MLDIVRIAALSDNYVWLVHDPASDETVAIDPSEAAPVLAAAQARGWRIGQVWNTHWHPDHTGGNADVKAATGAVITGPAAEAGRIATLDRGVTQGDTVTIGGHVATVMETPGHTAGHISFHFADAALLFPGDTLFAMGCGRLFEGTPEQMHANMLRFAALPPETIVYPAHEYTAANARFAASIDPRNMDVTERLAEVERLRAGGEATLPTTIAAELATNPFLRAPTAAVLAEYRAAKDAFRG